jgi:hypothetical protein
VVFGQAAQVQHRNRRDGLPVGRQAAAAAEKAAAGDGEREEDDGGGFWRQKQSGSEKGGMMTEKIDYDRKKMILWNKK